MATGTEESTFVRSVIVHNSGESTITLHVEPWGDEYALKHDESVQVIFDALDPGEPEVLHRPDRILVYGWPTAAVRVLKDGVDLRSGP